MRKDRRRLGVSEIEREYDARLGVRGKYLDRFGSDNRVEALHVWAPIFAFRWKGQEYPLAHGAWIHDLAAAKRHIDSPETKFFLSEEERERCHGTKHWLHLIHARGEEPSPRTRMNTFLLGLWLIRPTQAHVGLRLDVAESQVRTVHRVLDRFQWIPGQASDEIVDGDLQELAGLLGPMEDIYLAKQRLRNALVLTFRGCVSTDWQSAFVCFAAAAESLLTYSSKPGLTKRLAEAYDALAGRETQPTSGASGIEFARLYSIRSDIVHGRAFGRVDEQQNLGNLRSFSDLLRGLWRVVLASDTIRHALEESDQRRETFFKALV